MRLQISDTPNPPIKSDHPWVWYDERAGEWVLAKDWRVRSRGYELLVPGGFRCDLSSIPRVLRNLVNTFELSIEAPLVHDWLYRHGSITVLGREFSSGAAEIEFTRKETDKFFLDIMEQMGVSWIKRKTAYHLIRAFGGGAWQGMCNRSDCVCQQMEL